jgi:uncharacterized protein with FMN-binding domain
MPHIIAVLALVVIGVGFTLFQSTDEPIVIDTFAEVDTTPIQASTSEIISYRDDEEGEDNDDDEYEEEEEDINQPNIQPVVQQTTPQPATPITVPTPEAATYDYRNGAYTSNITYRTPEGGYSMTVTLTISNDKITTSDISYDSKTARDKYTRRFTNSYDSYVTGNDLDSVNLSRVGGASLTSNAFNKAIADIKNQASV